MTFNLATFNNLELWKKKKKKSKTSVLNQLEVNILRRYLGVLKLHSEYFMNEQRRIYNPLPLMYCWSSFERILIQ